MTLPLEPDAFVNLPIGVFDSGMGGLTVLRELTQRLPNESFVYLGDTARLPYGTKSQATVVRYALQVVATLMAIQPIKALVVACNTATTAALDDLKQTYPQLPIIGVVEPGARAAVMATQTQRVALLATETTIASGIYQQTLRALAPKIHVVTQPCGLFVALAEEGWTQGEIATAIAREYLFALSQMDNAYDCVILGCTHFPVLITPLREVLDESVVIVNSASATARSVVETLQAKQLLPRRDQVSLDFWVTDSPERFCRVGETFFGQPIPRHAVRLIDGVGSYHNLPTAINQPSVIQPFADDDTV